MFYVVMQYFAIIDTITFYIIVYVRLYVLLEFGSVTTYKQRLNDVNRLTTLLGISALIDRVQKI